MAKEAHVFSEADIKYIIDNWGKESPHSMKNKFGCTWHAVCKIAELNGLSIPKSNKWTEKEIKELENLAESLHYKEIASILGKTNNAVYLKARKLGIKLIQDRREWTKEEEIELQELWGYKTLETISKKMRRTKYSIKVKAIRMKLGPMINNNLELLSVSDLVDMLGVSRDRICNTWINLGLDLKKKKLTQKYSYYAITIEKLLVFLENNQNEWDSRNVEKYILGSEPEWLVEKRKRDLIENPLWYRRWTAEEIQKLQLLKRLNKSNEEIASAINRSEQAVAIVLRSLGYSYSSSIFWTGKEFKFLKDNYLTMTHEEMSAVLGRTPKAVAAQCENLNYLKRTRNKKNNY